MPEQDNQQPDAGGNPHNMPTRPPVASLVLHRTQAAMGLLRDVVQESSADYWYELGETARSVSSWEKAIYYYSRCRQTPKDLMRIQALEGLVTVLESRAEHKACEGDFEGSYWDKRSAEDLNEEL